MRGVLFYCWTAPDPIGDAGGDNDWYGYCLDNPVNAVDHLGLMGWSGGSIEENLSWESVLVWRTGEDACDACVGMDSMVIPNDADFEAMRPHPNCRCGAELCDEGLELGEWKVVHEGRPSYTVVFVMNNIASTTVIAIWKKITPVLEERTREKVRICSSKRTVLAEEKEQRKRNLYESQTTGAICWNSGGNASSCDLWAANNPWTDKTEVGRVPPGM